MKTKKKSKVLLKMYKCTMYSLLSEWLSTSLKRISRKQKKKERFGLCTILLEIICIDWAISMKLNVLECTSNCECFLLSNFKYSTWRISFNSYTVVLCTKSIAALCCHTALKLGVKINCFFFVHCWFFDLILKPPIMKLVCFNWTCFTGI